MTFEEWMNAVDDEIILVCGLTSEDLSDQAYRDWFDDGMDPTEAANEALLDNGFQG